MKPKTLIVTRCIIKNNDGEILLLKRTKDKTYNANKYELPGSKLPPFVDIKTSVTESIYKELGITVIPIEPNQKVYLYNRLVTENTKYKNHLFIEITLEAEYITGEPRVGEEHTNCIWIMPEDALDLDLSISARETITKYIYNHQRESLLTSKPKIQITSRAIIRKGSKILMIKRNSKSAFPNKWELPGGKIDALETLDHITREVFEETGLIIKVTRPSILTSSNIVNSGKYRGYTFIGIFSEAKIIGGKFKLSNEHHDFGWFTRKQILNLDLAEYVKFPIYKLLTLKK